MTVLSSSPQTSEPSDDTSQPSALDILLGPDEVSAEFPTCREEVDAYFTEKQGSKSPSLVERE